ncbi:glycosyltransferase [Pendulispora albinea]|uniref:Glycosyltransferase n=1 Tax=Pendulispora albinea TaxID=2741071 RepID=A0ABZ2LW98_9BACT
MKTGLNIGFFGSSLVSAYWNGAATYYRGIIKALHALGHRVTFYEPDAFERQKHRDIPDPPWADVVVYPAEDPAAVSRLVENAARKADVLVKASGVGVLDNVLEAAVLAYKRAGQTTIFWDVDAPATLARIRQARKDPLGELIPHYDWIWTYGGGDAVVNAYRSLGARACVPIYNAVDPETHFPVLPEARLTADVSLLANRLPDREERIDEFFFRPAASLPNGTFLLGGNGWHDKPLPPNVRTLGHVYTADHNALFASSNLVLNVSRNDMATVGYSPATRVFEAAGVGACIITDAWDGIDFFFEPGHEILVAQDGDHVTELVRSTYPGRARDIGASARQRVLRDHTYTIRAHQIESLLVHQRDNVLLMGYA